MKKFIHDVLKKAADLLNSHVQEVNIIRYKQFNGVIDNQQVVTESDLLVEKFIIAEIEKNFHDVNIISEEKAINIYSLQKPTWVIDPIDGSLNYLRGLKYYSISISYWENNEPLFAGVYSPSSEEMFYAEKKSGATLNDKVIHVSTVNSLDNALILLSGYDSFRKQSVENVFFRIILAVQNMRIFSSSILDMCYVAAGKCDARIYSNCKFWDLSAAKLILEEAGGLLTDWNGERGNLFSPLLIASNKHLHESFISLLNP